MRKKIKLLVLAAVYLGICWGIGQFRQTKNSADSQGADQNITLADQGVADVWKKAVFEGNQKTDDTPWGITAGWFEMEGEGSCILLLPDTKVTFGLSGMTDEISFYCQIHPWVKDSSDGVGLIIDLYDEANHTIERTELEIGNKDNWLEYKVDLKKYATATGLKLSCDEGESKDDTCDWLVLKPNLILE